jgi:hypothetical protein
VQLLLPLLPLLPVLPVLVLLLGRSLRRRLLLVLLQLVPWLVLPRGACRRARTAADLGCSPARRQLHSLSSLRRQQ